MRAIPIVLACATVFFAGAQIQPAQDRIFHFVNAVSPRQMQEIATVVRSVGDIPAVTVDAGQVSMYVRGTADQIALAAWLFNELDQSLDGQRPATQGGAVLAYRLPGGGEVARVFYLPYAKSLQEFQEVATAVRAVTGIPRMFTYDEPKAVVMRGTGDQATLAAWLFTQLGKPPDAAVAAQYRMPGGSDDAIEILNVPSAKTVQDFQEVAVVVRAIGDIKRLFTYNSPRAIALRGTSQQMALAEWLVRELDRSGSQSSASNEYRIPGAAENVIRVFYLPLSFSPLQFQQTAISVRTSTQMRSAFTYNALRALVLRGTPQQMAQAAALISEKNKPI